jgi:hypothetical protein
MVLTRKAVNAEIKDLEDAFWVLEAWAAEFAYLASQEPPEAVKRVSQFLWEQLGGEEYDERVRFSLSNKA